MNSFDVNFYQYIPTKLFYCSFFMVRDILIKAY